jgi:glutamate formiminotransferase
MKTRSVTRLLSPFLWHVTPCHCVTGARLFQTAQWVSSSTIEMAVKKRLGKKVKKASGCFFFNIIKMLAYQVKD